jgi:hypothetical protein
MTITLEDFKIANGDDRTLQVMGEETVELQQTTQVAPPSRAAWQVAFPERAACSMPLSYQVAFPPCATMEDALMQSRIIPVQCPKGGVLVEYHEGVRITYPQAWRNSVTALRRGVSNVFKFNLTAVNPAVEELVLDGSDGEIFTDGDDGEEFTY